MSQLKCGGVVGGGGYSHKRKQRGENNMTNGQM